MRLYFFLALALAASKLPGPAQTEKPAAEKTAVQQPPPPAEAPAQQQAKSAAPAPKSDPTPSGETLHYSINWPTGLSLGEARLQTTKRTTEDGARVETSFHLDASVPGFPVVEDHRSVADGEFCSIEFDKQYTHGSRKADETTTFDQREHQATRETKGGGKSDLSTPSCAKDALAYVGYIRRELGAGRLPPNQPVYFGAAYNLRVEFTGTQSVRVNDAPIQADRVVATLKGPKADISVEVFFKKDPARTPVMVRVPLTLATFSMELVRP